ncbi:hypothetical protein TRIP_D50003 [uncultured Paludibacter sp.]|nr:hypothetical protein TRIP_D50003 [uncultured Paludibacter sp.]
MLVVSFFSLNLYQDNKLKIIPLEKNIYNILSKTWIFLGTNFEETQCKLNFNSKMKKLTTFLAAFLLFVSVSQAQDINKLFKKYAGNDRFEYVSVGSLLMKFAKVFITDDYSDLTSRMKGLKILTLSQTDEKDALFTKFQGEITKLVNNKDFETMVASRSKGEDANIYRRITKKDNADVLIIVKNKNEINVIWFNGKATKEELDKIFTDENESDDSDE